MNDNENNQPPQKEEPIIDIVDPINISDPIEVVLEGETNLQKEVTFSNETILVANSFSPITKIYNLDYSASGIPNDATVVSCEFHITLKQIEGAPSTATIYLDGVQTGTIFYLTSKKKPETGTITLPNDKNHHKIEVTFENEKHNKSSTIEIRHPKYIITYSEASLPGINNAIIGDIKVVEVYLGDTPITNMYLGNTEIYSK